MRYEDEEKKKIYACTYVYSSQGCVRVCTFPRSSWYNPRPGFFLAVQGLFFIGEEEEDSKSFGFPTWSDYFFLLLSCYVLRLISRSQGWQNCLSLHTLDALVLSAPYLSWFSNFVCVCVFVLLLLLLLLFLFHLITRLPYRIIYSGSRNILLQILQKTIK